MDRIRDSGSLGYGSIPYRRTIKLSETKFGFRFFIFSVNRQFIHRIFSANKLSMINVLF